MAENSKDIVIRVFEGYGEKHTVKAAVFKGYGVTPDTVKEADLLENFITSDDNFSYDVQNRLLSFEIKPFEIKTFVVSAY
jgi:alpha-mannosidase